jgi:hypothetical protein
MTYPGVRFDTKATYIIMAHLYIFFINPNGDPFGRKYVDSS